MDDFASLCHSNSLLTPDWNYTDILLNNLKYFNLTYQPIHGYICVLLCSFGIFTNVLNVVILTRRNMRTSVNLVLAAIAFCDIGTMASYLVYVTRFNVMTTDDHCENYHKIYTSSWMTFILFHSLWSILLHSASLWLAVLLAVMRLAVIKRSKFSYKLLRASNVWKWVLYISIPLGLFCLPVAFTNSIIEIPMDRCHGNVTTDVVTHGRANSTAFSVAPSDLALANDCLLLKCTLWITGVAFKLLPCLVLFFAILGLTKTLSKAKRRKQRILQRKPSMMRANSTNHFSSRTTKMLVAIISIFIITELPQALLASISGLYTDVYFKIYPLLADLLDLLSLINSGVNFILYCLMSSRFRSVFTKIVTPTNWRRRRSQFSMTGTGGEPMSLGGFDQSFTLTNRFHAKFSNNTSVVKNGCHEKVTTASGSKGIEKTISAVFSYAQDGFATSTTSVVKTSLVISGKCSENGAI